MPDELVPAWKALGSSEPTRLLLWIRTSNASQILAYLAQTKRQLTHELLDEYANDRGIQILRSALVANEVLEQRDERLAEAERWFKQFTEGVENSAIRGLIANWGSWNYLRKFRKQSPARPISPHQVDSLQTDLGRAKRFLVWLDARGFTLRDCPQAELDLFLAESPERYRLTIRVFLDWARAAGVAPLLSIEPIERGSPRTPIEEDERWRLARRLLHDETIEDVDRLAGLLVLLYGQPLRRIVLLTTTDFVFTRKQTTLALGPTPIVLPKPMDAIARRLLKNRNHRVLLAPTDNSPWVFVGNHAGRHLSDARLSVRLKKVGVSPRHGRNAALIDLAGRVPAPVLSQLLGIDPNTAVVWAQVGGQTAGQYAGELVRSKAVGPSKPPAT